MNTKGKIWTASIGFPSLALYAITCNLRSSSAIIWNTVDFLEHLSLQRLQQHYKVPFFTVGPLHKISSMSSSTSLLDEDKTCLPWLDKQATSSVIYVSLGSLASIDAEELAETAWGLANSGQPFLWVIRPGSVIGSEWIELLPEGFIENTGERCHIVKWAPQKLVLAHKAVGGFWSHCGWNSTIESICEGKPMICRPFFVDQKVISRYLNYVWKIGLELESKLDRKHIESVIRRLFGDAEGAEMRERATEIKEKIESCMSAGLADDGASSWVKPQEFTIKVNVDAALFHEHGSVGAGMVARNFRGELIQAKTVLSVGVVQPELAETMAIKEALSWMERNGWHEGTIETDCLVAAQAIRSRIQMNSPFGVVVEECRNLLCRLNKISLLFVRRSANMAAHYVAKMSCSFPDRSFSGGDVPVELNNVMLGDLMI